MRRIWASTASCAESAPERMRAASSVAVSVVRSAELVACEVAWVVGSAMLVPPELGVWASLDWVQPLHASREARRRTLQYRFGAKCTMCGNLSRSATQYLLARILWLGREAKSANITEACGTRMTFSILPTAFRS